jgi:hypothetical protein
MVRCGRMKSDGKMRSMQTFVLSGMGVPPQILLNQQFEQASFHTVFLRNHSEVRARMRNHLNLAAL